MGLYFLYINQHCTKYQGETLIHQWYKYISLNLMNQIYFTFISKNTINFKIILNKSVLHIHCCESIPLI